jgi:hypothetical protein
MLSRIVSVVMVCLLVADIALVLGLQSALIMVGTIARPHRLCQKCETHQNESFRASNRLPLRDHNSLQRVKIEMFDSAPSASTHHSQLGRNFFDADKHDAAGTEDSGDMSRELD